MSTTSSVPLSVRLTPVGRIILPPGVTRTVHQVTVTNTGKGTVTMTTGSELITPEGRSAPCDINTSPSWLHISPATFKLAPGQSESTVVTINAPAGTNADLVAKYTATGNVKVTGHHGNVGVSGFVGYQTILSSGTATASVCGHAKHKSVTAAPVSHNGGIPALDIAGLSVLVVVLAILMVIFRDRLPIHRLPR